MSTDLTSQERRTHLLGILAVAGLICILLASIVLWIAVGAQTAVIVFTAGVGVFTVLALYVGKLVVDEERHMQARLDARDARYRQTLEILPEGVVILKSGGLIEWVNTAAAEHLGLTSEDIGLNFTEKLRQPEFEVWFAARDFSRHYTLEVQGGHLILDIAVIAPDERHTLIVTHNITERRRLDEMRRDFVANVSHELRTPLTVIAGFLDLADAEMEPEVRARHLELMRGQTLRMKRLTDDLLTLSKLENRDERMDETPVLVDMGVLVDEAVKEGMALSHGRHHFDVKHEDLLLLGYTEEIRSAILNLISNAVRYTPEGGSIRVTWERQGTGASLTVSDTGIGIAPEHISRITERFYRVDRGRSRETGGTGLGLAIVKHVMRRSGGELLIRSEPGKGSVFTLHFPEERLFGNRFY